MARMKQQSRRGVTIVESAFMIPILMLLIFGAIEFGSILHMRHTMLHAAREAARTLAIEGGTVTAAETVAKDLLPESTELNFLVEATAPAPDALNRDVRVNISVPLAEAALGDIFGMFGDSRMGVEIVMRSEQ
jgi:Flp pilus assembly protein TadG